MTQYLAGATIDIAPTSSECLEKYDPNGPETELNGNENSRT